MKKGWIMLLLGIGLAVSLGWGFQQYTDLRLTKQELSSYKDIENLNQRSEDFARAYARGKHKEYLTKAAIQQFAKQDTREKGYENLDIEDSGLNEVELKQLFTKRTINKENQAESYATMRLQYDVGGTDSPTDDYIQTFSVHSFWMKEDGIWKVNDVNISLTGDSADDELRRQAQEALENATKARDSE
ncbi:hypothetical protein [Paenibacillus crassostreae]|uniref:Uncharacterized protein n=1 Tax=Paenibacillus crassostreae TaxID=1763538 RepID=A0A167EKD5_9BACL|nr:hypothetical protein [Paenibacillus crassostreae]AOZ94873.1 hypothetical protein LPB68_21660 [Paenibacillus crassostreae]OAB75628.1 hypothetical protein PNBC_08350 [Paenibacillus crassostreae]